MDDIKRALLGSKEAAQRLTEAGVLMPCPFCKGKVRRVIGVMGLNFFKCKGCGAVVSFDNDYFNAHPNEARLAWNTRAPILTETQIALLKIAQEPRKFREGEK